jgi:hypothetical protein
MLPAANVSFIELLSAIGNDHLFPNLLAVADPMIGTYEREQLLLFSVHLNRRVAIGAIFANVAPAPPRFASIDESLNAAANSNDVALMKLLIDHNNALLPHPCNTNLNTALATAANRGNKAMVLYLLRQTPTTPFDHATIAANTVAIDIREIILASADIPA